MTTEKNVEAVLSPSLTASVTTDVPPGEPAGPMRTRVRLESVPPRTRLVAGSSARSELVAVTTRPVAGLSASETRNGSGSVVVPAGSVRLVRDEMAGVALVPSSQVTVLLKRRSPLEFRATNEASWRNIFARRAAAGLPFWSGALRSKQ
jgi:hypothetical protein